MRSFGNRPDCHVVDEPLYAHYLEQKRREHPVAAKIVAHGETDWRRVVDRLLGPLPNGDSVFYQKHMAHHLLEDISRDWLAQVTNCFLIREPREMLTSLLKVLPEPTLEETGLPQQIEIFYLVRRTTGVTPPVLDSKDTLDDPERVLRLLCDAIGLEFTDDMLAWPPGARTTDGIWASEWYGAVEKSTGFRPYRPKPDAVPERFQPLLALCEELYAELYRHRLGA